MIVETGAIRPRATTNEGWWPGLDGIRGVAVLAVLLYHHQASRMPGGFLGVSLFFTLSGFLLTTLVLREHARSGEVVLRRFWARRLRRLVPVALIGLALATAVTIATVDGARVVQTLDDIRFAALDLANWRFAFRSVSYGDTVASPSPVLHFWSLAIEEQIYLLFPIVAGLALRRGVRAFAFVLGLIVMFSLLRQLSIPDVNRIYLGTDTRVAELAVGALAAIVWSSHGHRIRTSMLDLLGAISAAILGISWLVVPLETPLLWHGGIILYSVASAILVISAVGGRVVPGVLGVGPLTAIGRVSYGVYVFHLPLFLLLSPDRTGLSGAELFTVRLAASVGAAAVVHRLVEAPVRWGRALPGRQALLAMSAGFGAVLVLATSLASLQSAGNPAPVAHTTVATMAAPVNQPSIAAAAAEPLADTLESTPGPRAPASGMPASGEAQGPTTAGPLPVPRLLVFGDSTAQANGVGMQKWASATHSAEVDVVAQLACTFVLDGTLRIRDGWVVAPPPPCMNLLDDAISAANQVKPDAIVVFIGSMQLADWKLPGDTRYRALGDPVLDARYTAAASAAVSRLESVGVPVLYADVATPDWDPAASGNGTFPGSGHVTINDPVRTARLNDLDAMIIGAHPATRAIAYANKVQQPDGSVDPRLRPDGLHLTPEAAASIMSDWLADELVAGYRSVISALPATLTRKTTWWSG